jgi:hypothetical protein
MFITEESKKAQTTGHMTHVGDWAIYGDPSLPIKHLEAIHSFIRGSNQPEHSVSLKADGGVSVLLGRKPDNRVFVAYKTAKKIYHTPEEIDAAGVPYGEDIKKLLQHAQSMPIKPGSVFQGDILWADPSEIKSGKVRPNTVEYKIPKSGNMGIAVHGQYRISDDGLIEKHSSVPDIGMLRSPSVHVPDLQMNTSHLKLNPTEHGSISRSIERARKSLTPEVASYAESIVGNKKLHKFLQEYLNEVVATTGKRDVASLKTYIHKPLSTAITSKAYKEKPTQRNLSEKGRASLVDMLETHIGENSSSLKGLFDYMNHIRDAKHSILDALGRSTGSHALIPSSGHEHEGIVSALGIPGQTESLAKLTREGKSGFSSKNRARGVERGFYGEVNEEMMTASSGGVSGMGYNLGGPPPDDVKIMPKAQQAYAETNATKDPPSRMSQLIAKAVKRKLSMLNVGREAY